MLCTSVRRGAEVIKKLEVIADFHTWLETRERWFYRSKPSTVTNYNWKSRKG